MAETLGTAADEKLVRCRRQVLDTGDVVEQRMVECPITGVSSLEACMLCSRFRAHEGGETLRCIGLASAAESEPRAIEALGEESWCLDPEVLARTALEVLESRGLWSAPVVDDRGFFLGMVDVDSLARCLRLSVDGDVVAEEAMHPPEMLIQADALLSTTAARMTSRNVREAPVVASNGIVVGVLTIQNLERWYTRHSSQPGPQQP